MKRRRTDEELRDLFGVLKEPCAGAGRVVRRHPRPAHMAHERFVIWSAARAEANLAYDDWCSTRGAEAYAIYRAAEDRADAAEAALARAARLAA